MCEKTALLPGERLDDLQYKGLKIIQDRAQFRFGTDAVLLAAFAQARAGERVADLGTGTGVILLLLCARTGANGVGIELLPQAAALARRNVCLNGMEGKIRIEQGDLRNARALVGGRVQAVVCNPPYQKTGTGSQSMQEAHRLARHEAACTLGDVAASAAGLLQTGGRFYMIYPAHRIAEALFALKSCALEPKQLRFVQRRVDAPPKLALIKCVRDAAEGVDVRPPLVLYDEAGCETPELRAIYHKE